jgi:polyisoprenoid-binding protein YceI
MKGEKLFDTQKFPEATFKSTKIEKTGEKTGKVTGDLTIKGVTKPVTLDVTLNFSGAHPMSKKATLGFGASGTVKRTDFGVSQAAPFVSENVSLEIQTEMQQKI